MNRQKNNNPNASHEFSILDAYDSYEINPNGRNIFCTEFFLYLWVFLFRELVKYTQGEKGGSERNVFFCLTFLRPRKIHEPFFLFTVMKLAFATRYGHHIQRDREGSSSKGGQHGAGLHCNTTTARSRRINMNNYFTLLDYFMRSEGAVRDQHGQLAGLVWTIWPLDDEQV